MTTPRAISDRRDATLALRHGVIAAGVLLTTALLVMYAGRHELSVDFRGNYWPAARAVLDGAGPYGWTHAQILAGTGFAYPAFTALVLTPLATLPANVAADVFLVALLLSVPATMRVLGVRDPVVHGVALLQWPVINAWQSGNVTLVLALLVALVWRYRERPVACALLTAVAVSLKPLVWPLWLWLLATRRYRALVLSVGVALVVNAACFAALGWSQISAYLHLASAITSATVSTRYGIPALVMRAGGSEQLGLALLACASVCLAAIAVRVGRRGHDPGALAIVCALALAASPLVWNHYFALLIVPVAIAEPRLGRGWLLLLPLWLCPSLHVTEWQSALAWAVTALVVARLAAGEARPARSVAQATNPQIANTWV